jgi:hypothetical protein
MKDEPEKRKARNRANVLFILDPSSLILHPFYLIDALRGVIRDAFPDGLAPQLNLRRVDASTILG